MGRRWGLLKVYRCVESVQWHMMIRQFCEPVRRRFVSEAVLNGLWTPPKEADIEDDMEVEWMPPVRGHIYPIQEVESWLKAAAGGITSRKRLAAQLNEMVERLEAELHGAHRPQRLATVEAVQVSRP